MTSQPTKLKVFLAGASGETGRSIAQELLATPHQFQVTALARPESATNKTYQRFAQQGATVVPINIHDTEALYNLFAAPANGGASSKDKVVIISCLSPGEHAGELTLVEAARRARVDRFVPSFWASPCPPRGVQDIRDAKEEVFDAIKRAYVPYTAIDVGMWYQGFLPRLPSARLDSALTYLDPDIVGTGDMPTMRIDQADIGKFVARIIVDDRTLNKLVVAYGDVKSQREIWDMFQALAGEEIPRVAVSAETIEEAVSSGRKALAKDPSDVAAFVAVSQALCKLSWYIRGDNTPEHARYLGYLDATELYPDLVTKRLEDYIRDVLEGKSHGRVYEGKYGNPARVE